MYLLLSILSAALLPILSAPRSSVPLPGDTTKTPSSTHGYSETTTQATMNFTSTRSTPISRYVNVSVEKLPPIPKLMTTKLRSRQQPGANLKSAPCNSANQVRFNFTVFPIYLESVDVRLASCKLHFHVVKEWRDTRLKCEASKNGMTGGVMKSVDSLWTPDFEPYNGMLKKSKRPDNKVMVFPDGRIRQVQSYSLVTPVRRSSGFFKPICEIRFASWMSKQLKLNGKTENIVDMTRFTENNQWVLDKDITKVSYPSGYLEVRAAIIFSLRQGQPML